MRSLLLLALVGLVAARCPEGMRPLTDDEIGAATQFGIEGWAINAKQQWCDLFPEDINDYGLEYYNTTITPYCKSEDGTYHFTIETKNPCDENKFYVGYMDVATNSSTCPQEWVGTAGFNSTVSAQPFDEASFQPLECGAGFRPAFDDELESEARQLLWQTLVEPTFQGLTAGQFDDAWYCDDTPGYKYINVTDVSACFSKTRDFPPKIETQGKVEWVCAQQARRRTIELSVASPYVLQCLYEVDIQMGDSPEVPQPGA